jgi:hypothetical protein
MSRTADAVNAIASPLLGLIVYPWRARALRGLIVML